MALLPSAPGLNAAQLMTMKAPPVRPLLPLFPARSNYIVEFPEQATATQRSLILSAIFSAAYQLFERKGGDDG